MGLTSNGELSIRYQDVELITKNIPSYPIVVFIPMYEKTMGSQNNKNIYINRQEKEYNTYTTSVFSLIKMRYHYIKKKFE